MPSKSTDLRMAHFDEHVYSTDSSTFLYKWLDAMCGDAGAGSLKKEIFLQRLSGAIDGIYGSDLDYVFGNVRFLSRNSSESYPYDPMTGMLTSDQWDEVRVKDAWYRARITEFFQACQAGGTIDGVRLACHAATSVDCTVYEVWRYMDSYGLTGALGRSPTNARSEFVVQPHKDTLAPSEKRQLAQMLERISPIESVPTINTEGLSVSTPVPVRAIAADSAYYQIEKLVTPTPVLDSIPAPELLAIDLDDTEKWLFKKSKELAPYGQFNISSEYGYYYLMSGGARSPIDGVLYSILLANGSTKPEIPFQVFETSGQFTAWQAYDKADSPDNYPGGMHGLTPDTAPALNPDHSPYQFAYPSQAAYVAQRKDEVLALGGHADDLRYQLPIQAEAQSKRTYTPDLAIAYRAPTSDSTVTSSWSSRKPRQARGELRDGAAFVRA
jgi:hypothetical protein